MTFSLDPLALRAMTDDELSSEIAITEKRLRDLEAERARRLANFRRDPLPRMERAEQRALAEAMHERMQPKQLLRWLRPTHDQCGNTMYTSKCGRFVITRREYSLPYASIGYTLSVDGKPEGRWVHDRLADAKEAAEHADEK